MPLALALLNVSSPDMTVMDTLSRLSHDTGGCLAATCAIKMVRLAPEGGRRVLVLTPCICIWGCELAELQLCVLNGLLQTLTWR